MGNQSLTVTIAQLDPLELELLSGDDSIEITTSTRPNGGLPVKKTYRTTLNSVLSIYARRRDNPNQVTAEQVGTYSIEQIAALLKEKLGVDGIAVNSLKLDGATKSEIIAEARAGTVENSSNLGGRPAADYLLSDEFNVALTGLRASFDDLTAEISDPSLSIQGEIE